MKLFLLLFVSMTVLIGQCECQWLDRWAGRARQTAEDLADIVNFKYDAIAGAAQMGRAYLDMREANYKNSDRYFHARGNYDASRHGLGGRVAAEVISDIREGYQSGLSGQGAADNARDQEANRHGRNGGDPNKYRPWGLPPKY